MKLFQKKCMLVTLFIASAINASASEQLASNFLIADLAIETVVIQGYRMNLLGETSSASQGVIGSEEIANRPLLRTGEILEFIPGMVVTQHSGSGKANQYFLRGFNLDHGTDFNTSIDGMPINMRTHGHGQGYTDLNFIIPELIQSIQYQKGPYYADVGDFSGAGSAKFNIKNKLGNSLVSVTTGEDNFLRVLAGGDIALTRGELVAAFEHQAYDGPWSTIDEDVAKRNLLIRYSPEMAGSDLSITLMAYKNRWNSADQIPDRAVRETIIDALGSLDTSVGGDSSRYSLSTAWKKDQWQASAYAIHSSLDLFSNFTYFLDDPINGDQFEQVDERTILGGEIANTGSALIANKQVDYKVGTDFRYDNISKVALYHTRERTRIGTTREDAVDEGSIGLFGQSSIPINERFHVHLGMRYDFYSADVNSNITQNSGDETQGKFSTKLGASYKITDNMEAYANIGQGFHSNDARGATITRDPVTGEASEAVNLIVPSTGGEVGLKLFDAERFNISTSLWYLRSDSELVFVGDAGNTEASRASERYGSEIAAYLWLANRWSFDLELAWTRAKFTQNEIAEGKYVDGSVPFVASAGITYGAENGWHGSLRHRYFGARRLDSFNSHRAEATSTTNLGVGYKWSSFNLELDVLNLFNSKDHDIDYFYSSRLNGEPEAGADDLHYHPVEPRSLRLKAEYKF